MLSNKHRYTLLRAIQFLIAPVYTVFSLFLRKDNTIILTSSHNNEFSDSSRVLFEALYNNEQYKGRVFFVINNTILRNELNEKYKNQKIYKNINVFISNRSIRNCLFILRARFWFCTALEMPVPSFFQRYFRQVCHLGHGMPIKRFGLLEKNATWYKRIYYFFITKNISQSIITTEFFAKDIAAGYGLKRSQLLLMPQPTTSQIAAPQAANNKYLANHALTHVLYAPTWRPYATVKLFPFSDVTVAALSAFLIEHNIHIWIRAHPRFEQEVGAELLACSNIHIFSAKQYSEVNAYLSYFDALITDYSSIYYDFLRLERPVLFFDYDFKKYSKEIGVIDRYNEIKCTETTTSFVQMKQQLLAVKQENFDLSRIKAINQLTNYPVPNSEIMQQVLSTLNAHHLL